MKRLRLIHGKAEQVLPSLADASADSVVADPPYALDFMGKDWDSFGDGAGYQVWCEQWAREVLRVLKPGGHLLVFGGTRTYHREACAIEDAGFEIRDSLHWIYGSGFPKSLDVSKAIDKAAGAEREVIGKLKAPAGNKPGGASYNMSVVGMPKEADITAPATPAAARWSGWGTALKPAYEPIILARKPFRGTVAANVLEHGTGALNIDGCRIATGDNLGGGAYAKNPTARTQMWGEDAGNSWRRGGAGEFEQPPGRWPPNILLTHSPDCADPGPCAPGCPVAEMDGQSGNRKGGGHIVDPPSPRLGAHGVYGKDDKRLPFAGYQDEGGASRFFPVFRYQAKAKKAERPSVEIDGKLRRHPTVKPLALMQWLVRLVTPPDGLVLDPFAGTGTTAEAALAEGMRAVIIEELDTDEHPYVRMACKRLGLEPGDVERWAARAAVAEDDW